MWLSLDIDGNKMSNGVGTGKCIYSPVNCTWECNRPSPRGSEKTPLPPVSGRSRFFLAAIIRVLFCSPLAYVAVQWVPVGVDRRFIQIPL